MSSSATGSWCRGASEAVHVQEVVNHEAQHELFGTRVSELGPLWLVGAVPGHRRGNIIQAAGGLPAVMWQSLSYPEHPALEARELLSLLCAGVIGLAEVVHRSGVELPAKLERWAVAPSAPAAEFGAGDPALAILDGQPTLAMRWNIERWSAVATGTARGYVFALVEDAAAVTELTSINLQDPAQGGP